MTSSLRGRIERVIEGGIVGTSLVSVLAILLIFAFVLREAAPVLYSASVHAEGATVWAFITTTMWQPVGDVPKFGFAPLLAGTIKVAFIAMLVGTPLAIAAAVFTSEFAGRRLAEIIKPFVEILASLPSVVVGFFALMVMASVLQDLFHLESRLNAFNGGLALGIAIIPSIYSISEDALAKVPKSFREASLAMGAGRWQTIWNVVIPAARSGILAAIILGLGRALGETMIVLLATGNAALTSFNPFESVRTISATIAAELPECVSGDGHYATLFFLATVLFTLTFVLNLISGIVIDRLRFEVK